MADLLACWTTGLTGLLSGVSRAWYLGARWPAACWSGVGWGGGLVDWWTGGLVTGGLVDWWTGGLVDWWTGGLVDWWTGGLVDWWTGGLPSGDVGRACWSAGLLSTGLAPTAWAGAGAGARARARAGTLCTGQRVCCLLSAVCCLLACWSSV